MPLMDCDAPETPTPILSPNDAARRLSFLKPNLFPFRYFTFTGGLIGSAYAEDPFTGYGSQKRALIIPGGDATAAVQSVNVVWGRATAGKNGGAYNIGIVAYLRGGATAGQFKGGYRNYLSAPLSSSGFPNADYPAAWDAADDKAFVVTDVPTFYPWEHIASDDPDFDAAVPNNTNLRFFVDTAFDIPAGSELVITEIDIQLDDFYAPWAIDRPWRPNPNEKPNGMYDEYVLNANYVELLNRRQQRMTSALEGTNILMAPNGPVRVIDVPEASFAIDAASDGTLITTTGDDPDVVQEIVVTPTDVAGIRTKSRFEVRQGRASRYRLVPGAGVTLNPPVGGSLESVGIGSVMEVTKRSSEDIFDVTSTANPLVYILLECGDETTAITTGTAKKTFRTPCALTVLEVKAGVTTAPTGANIILDINEAGSSILSTKLSIDAGEKTSKTAATPPVLSDIHLADDAEMTIDFDQVGSTIAGAGVKIWLIGYATNTSVTGSALAITSTPEDCGNIGVAFSSGVATATGGVEPYTWSIASGTLPGGLSIDPDTGEISGTPTTIELQALTLRVTDAAGSTDDRAFSISIESVTDASYGSVVLLMGFEGSIADEKAGLTVTTSGAPTRVGSPPYCYGDEWLELEAADSDRVHVAETSNQWHLSADFTIEFTANLETWGGILLSHYLNTGNDRSWYIWFDILSGTKRFGMTVNANGTTSPGNVDGVVVGATDAAGAPLVTGQAYRFCLERSGNTWRAYVDGVMVGSATNTTAVFNSSQGLDIGAWNSSGFTFFWDGNVDEIRITKGVARYASDSGYTPRRTPFPRS